MHKDGAQFFLRVFRNLLIALPLAVAAKQVEHLKHPSKDLVVAWRSRYAGMIAKLGKIHGSEFHDAMRGLCVDEADKRRAKCGRHWKDKKMSLI
jgi:hypothetical protein